ncbi:DNA adenine methylase [Buttiauxella sp. A2-C2_NF]|uniref:DNA adenine methylase n=1 Tax=Buttiauxella ferragutiae TaxID=82989 RepID=UPI001E527AFE|nr:DNA adenine methylase [Buttiauxella ferragutiae]MCE0828211.1 DNA adenine methylase [Buttiauxella ferragutiae]
MAKTFSPLRYPGGKSAIYPMVSAILEHNFTGPCRYIEPYAGGGGLALSLLFGKEASEIHLNDLDRSIWAVWNSILNQCDEFIDRIRTTNVTIDEWHKQRDIQNNKYKYSDLDVGFSSFFLNRTNRSGIILKAGVIGGLSQSNEKYKLDCRFNKQGLIDRIIKIHNEKDRIHIYNMDAIDFLKKIDAIETKNNCVFIDPPYYEKGSSLYTNFYEKNDHENIFNTIARLKSKWILTYDNASKIKDLYKSYKSYEFYLNYSLAKKRVGTELLFCNNNVSMPPALLGDVLVSQCYNNVATQL